MKSPSWQSAWTSRNACLPSRGMPAARRRADDGHGRHSRDRVHLRGGLALSPGDLAGRAGDRRADPAWAVAAWGSCGGSGRGNRSGRPAAPGGGGTGGASRFYGTIAGPAAWGGSHRRTATVIRGPLPPGMDPNLLANDVIPQGRVAQLEEQMDVLHGQVAELAERLDFAERLGAPVSARALSGAQR